MRCATDYLVTQRTGIVPAGGTLALTFRAEGGEPTLFDRILIGAASAALPGLHVESATINRELRVVSAPVHVVAVNRLFRRGRLSRPFVIAPENVFEITLRNDGAEDAFVNVKLVPAQVTDDLAKEIARVGAAVQPRLLTLQAEVPAGAEALEVRMEAYAVALSLYRYAVAAADEDALLIGMRIGHEPVRRDEFASQITDEYDSAAQHAPLVLHPRERLVFELANLSDAEPNLFSFIGEGEAVGATLSRQRTALDVAGATKQSAALQTTAPGTSFQAAPAPALPYCDVVEPSLQAQQEPVKQPALDPSAALVTPDQVKQPRLDFTRALAGRF